MCATKTRTRREWSLSLLDRFGDSAEEGSNRSVSLRAGDDGCMFRIKTDIRQYKCESREKVERLIRNWVVRPTDLIFYDDKEEWGPIGEHSEFVSTFAELSQREAEAPDTIVSSDPPPVGEEEEADEGESAPDQEGDDATDEDLEPPEPPEGVEPQRAEPDEITVMTEETLEDYLREEGAEEVVAEGRDEDLGDSSTDPEPEPEETKVTAEAPTNPDTEPPDEIANPAGPDVPTEPEDLRPPPGEREGASGEPTESTPESATVEAGETDVPPAERSDEPTEPEAEPPEEMVESEADPPDVTRPDPDAVGDEPVGPDDETLPPEVETAAAEEETEPLRDTDEFDDEESEAEPTTGTTAPGVDAPESDYEVAGDVQARGNDENLGRHDLPEEVFVTNELTEDEADVDSISGYRAEGDVGARPSSAGGSAGYERVEDALQQNVKSARQDHVDDEWDDILERLRETDELSSEEIEEITKTRDEFAIGRDEGEQPDEDQDVPDEIEEYVSEGYERELPISPTPSKKDVRLGLRRSRASKGEKDRAFPHPSPKREGEPIQRSFVLRPPKDHSLKVIVGLVVCFVLLVATAVLLF